MAQTACTRNINAAAPRGRGSSRSLLLNPQYTNAVCPCTPRTFQGSQNWFVHTRFLNHKTNFIPTQTLNYVIVSQGPTHTLATKAFSKVMHMHELSQFQASLPLPSASPTTTSTPCNTPASHCTARTPVLWCHLISDPTTNPNHHSL